MEVSQGSDPTARPQPGEGRIDLLQMHGPRGPEELEIVGPPKFPGCQGPNQPQNRGKRLRLVLVTVVQAHGICGRFQGRGLPACVTLIARPDLLFELELDKLLRILPSRRNTEDLLRRLRTLTEQGDFSLLSFVPRALARSFVARSCRPATVRFAYSSLKRSRSGSTMPSGERRPLRTKPSYSARSVRHSIGADRNSSRKPGVPLRCTMRN